VQYWHIEITNQKGDDMTVTLNSVRKAKAVLPMRALFYSPPKIGKTTLASEFPAPIFIQLEEGENQGSDFDTFGVLEDYDDVSAAMRELATQEHEYKTLAIDTVDALEPLISKKVCRDNNWPDIGYPGFGKGYAAAAEIWAKLLNGTNMLRRQKGMNIIFLGHSKVVRFDPPGMDSFSRYTLRTHERVSNMIMDDVDVIGFINKRADLIKEDAGFGNTKTHATGGDTRWIYAEGRPAYEAGSRYNLQGESILRKGTLVADWASRGVPIAGYTPEKPTT
jgi:hypothetical protein